MRLERVLRGEGLELRSGRVRGCDHHRLRVRGRRGRRRSGGGARPRRGRRISSEQRPCTLILLLATCTKRLRWWKKSARSKNVPPNLNVSGTSSSVGAVDVGVVEPLVLPLAPVAPVVP